MPQPRSTSPQRAPATVEPSRAWILGLVVEADGSLASSVGVIPEWPSAGPAAAVRTPARVEPRDAAPPAARPHTTARGRQVIVDPSTCACPDDCTIDHEYA
jgi:hypothetical protein